MVLLLLFLLWSETNSGVAMSFGHFVVASLVVHFVGYTIYYYSLFFVISSSILINHVCMCYCLIASAMNTIGRVVAIAITLCVAVVVVTAEWTDLTQITPNVNVTVGKDECNGKPWGTAGQFDFYVFEQSWAAEFCHSKSSYPGCKQPTDFMRKSVTIHGT
jgi:hypothetical protein